MMKYLLVNFLIILPTFSNVEELIFHDYQDINQKYNQSHFVFHAEVSLMTYKSENQLNLTKSDLIERDDSKLYWGPSLGFGRRFFLNQRISLSANIEAFYMKNSEVDTRTYSEDFDRTIYSNKDENYMFGGRLFSSLYLRTQFKSFYIEPFITIGAGYSLVKNKIDYSYNDLVNKESLSSELDENFTNIYYGLGVNILSTSGLLVYLKAQKSAVTIGKSKISGTSSSYRPVSSATNNQKLNLTTKDINKNRDEINFSIGFGYIF